MKKFCFLFLCIFLISINKIHSFNDLKDCPEGKYGSNCEENCNCNLWSSSKNCSKIEGRCLDCKFGHFGINCDNICDPRCKTNLCCAVYSSNFKSSKNMIKGKISSLSIKINNKPDNKSLNIDVDYNVGYPLAIFKKTLKEDPFDQKPTEEKTCYYTNYGEIRGGLYKNVNISINDNQIQAHLPVVLVEDENITIGEDINGVIGLGFLNSINENLFNQKEISENIASYELNEDTDEISILFGDLFEDGKNYVHKLSYCNAISNQNSQLSMKCKVDAIGTRKYLDALEIQDTYITFSLNEKSSFVLKNNKKYIDYIEKYYFRDEDLYKSFENNNNSKYYCFKTKKINRLNNFGFIINKYYYSFQANVYFSDNKTENKEKCESDEYSKFMIEFTNNDSKVGIVFGKSFYKETQFTIDNEERKIYLYTRNAEYFTGKMKSEFTSTPGISLEPITISFITIGIIFFMNASSFLLYYLCKRKKQQNIEKNIF